jgi:hypothetical protein
VFNPDLNEMYAREWQHDYRQEAAEAALAREVSAPRLDVHLMARLGQWFRRPQRRPASAVLPRRHVPAAGD